MSLLYDEGVGEDDWTEGFASGTGSQSKAADHLLLVGGSSGLGGGSGHRSWVTETTVDFSDVDAVEVDWANDGHADGESYLVVSTSKTSDHNVYDERLAKTTTFARDTEQLDTSDLTGPHHVRVHARHAGANASQVKTYQARLVLVPAEAEADPLTIVLDLGPGVLEEVEPSIPQAEADPIEIVLSLSGPTETSGTWTSQPVDLTRVGRADGAWVEVDATVPDLARVTVQSSVDGGEWQNADTWVVLPDDLDGVTVRIRLVLGAYDTFPTVHSDPILHVTAREHDETIPLGMFGPVKIAEDRTPQGTTVNVSGHDRSANLSGQRLPRPMVLPAGDEVVASIKRLIRSGDEDARIVVSDVGTHLHEEDRLLDAGADPWQQARQLAESIGAEVHVDHLDRYVLRPVPDPGRPVLRWTSGDGLLLGIRRDTDPQTLRNGVVVVSNAAHLLDPVIAEAWDDDADSPTRRDLVGEWPEVIDTGLADTVEQAQAMADGRLREIKGTERHTTVTIVPYPALDAWDAFRVTDRDGDVELVARRVPVPLTAEGTTTVETSSRRV